MPQQGLSDAAIEQETAVALPERDAMSLVDGGVKLVPISGVVVNPPPTLHEAPPLDPTDQATDERAAE